MSMKFAAFVDDSVSVDGGLYTETRIEIHAFGERVAYKRSGDDFRTAGGLGAVPWGVPPEALGILAGLAFAGLLAWSANQGALVLVIQRPGYAGVSAALVVVLVLGPFPGVPVSRAGGGGEANFYWELGDPLGTGMVMLDETGARRVHRTYSPFGAQTASAGPGNWLPRHYAGHLADEDSGLVYMQARWMDPESGTFLSIDPLVADAADPQAFNAYAYARNNPRSFTDPTGASASWEWQLPIDSGWFVYTGIEGGIQQFTLILYGLGEAFTPGDSSGGGWGGLSSLGVGDMGGSGYGGGLNSGGGSGGSGRASQSSPTPTNDPSGTEGQTFGEAAANGGGAAAGIAEFSNVRNGMWKGLNGKWYSIDAAAGKVRAFFGNQYTGSRNAVLERAGSFRMLGRSLWVASAGMSISDMYQAYQNGDPSGVAKAGLDIGMSGVATFGGPVGLAVGTTYFVVDAFGAIPLGH